MAAIPAGKGKFIAGGVVGAFLLVLIVSNGSTFNGANQPLNSGQFVSRPVGTTDTMEFKRYFFDLSGKKVSPWHDVPLKPTPGAPDNVVNFICEIPKGSRAKMETNKENEFNPFIQDTKKGKLRYYHSDSLVNYGALPQTWEDPGHEDTETKLKGDNDPLDAIEIGSHPCQSGDIFPVKVVGILGMEDDGEMDWKVVVVAMSDPLAANLEDVGFEHVDENAGVQEFLVSVREWFRDYKIPDGKPANKFAFDDKYLGAGKAVSIVKEQHQYWKDLVAKEPKDAKDDYKEFWWTQRSA